MKKAICTILFLGAFAACATTQPKTGNGGPGPDTQLPPQGTDSTQALPLPEEKSDSLFEPAYKKPEEFNIRLIVSGSMNSPQKIYYRVSIDDEDAGRTTIGTDAEEKVFESTASPAKHVLLVEKFILDQAKDRYVRVKNIDQPKPDSLEFDLPADRILVIRLVDNGGDAPAEYRTEFERDGILPEFGN